MMVLADVVTDRKLLEKTVADAVNYSLYNTGQVCCAVERVYIAQDIYENLVVRIGRYAEKHHVLGRSLQQREGKYEYDASVTVGPLVSEVQRDHVARQVDDALAKGARLVYRSVMPADIDTSSCWFYPITVLADVNDTMDIYHTETFGPVVCCIPFDGTVDRAVALANDSPYGLCASVYSADTAQATSVARHIQAGQVGINCYALDQLHVSCPWVGFKNSGYGYHSGLEGFAQFSLPQTLVYSEDRPP
jgi:acyl-CoA reductase-like NAD-dependent aldehyde dehydrogenase